MKIRRWILERKIRRAIDALVYLENIMKIKGYTRQFRRSLWRDVVGSIETRDGIRQYLKEWIKDLY